MKEKEKQPIVNRDRLEEVGIKVAKLFMEEQLKPVEIELVLNMMLDSSKKSADYQAQKKLDAFFEGKTVMEAIGKMVQ